MLHLNSKKLIKIIISLVCVALIAVIALVVAFFASTTNDIEGCCKENSFRNATQFAISSDNSIDGYLFAVAQNGDDEKGQELFIFREQHFGVIKNTKRFVLEYHSDAVVNQTVGSFSFKPNGAEKSDYSFLVLYSDNAIQATTAACRTLYNENGKDVSTNISFSLQDNQPFICITTPLKAGEIVESAVLKNANDEIVFSY